MKKMGRNETLMDFDLGICSTGGDCAFNLGKNEPHVR